MAFKRKVLVLANVTAGSAEVLEALCERAAREPAVFTLIVPATRAAGGRVAAAKQLEMALAAAHERGLDIDGWVGAGDPMVAVAEAWDPGRYDEIIVSTLPSGASKWLGADLPHRIQRHTGALVTHVVSRPPRPQPDVHHLEPHENYGVLRPLTVLTWGHPMGDRGEAESEPDRRSAQS